MSHRLKLVSMNVLLVVVTAVAIFPLFQKRYIPTHDGEYHIIRIVEFSKMISSGYLFPRWAPTLNSGYGVPIFQFNYPLPNYVGTLIRLITQDAVYAYQYSMGFGYILLVVGMFYWLNSLFGRYAALVGTITGMYVPYIFLDMYIRGSIGEIWATGFLFLTLFFIEKKMFIPISFSIAGLIVSHNIMAMVYTPFIVVYCMILGRKLLWPVAGGIGMSAFFWLPAMLESKFVVGLNTVNFREHFVQLYEFLIPSWGSQFSGTGSVGSKVSFQIGLAPILGIVFSLFSFRSLKHNKIKQLYGLFVMVLLICIFFMTSASKLIWENVSLLQNVQYPWRLLAFVIPSAAFCAAVWAQSLHKRWAGVLFVLFAVAVSYSYARPVTYEPRNEAYYVSRENFTDGTSSMGNSFSTVWTGWKQIKANEPVELVNGTLVDTVLDSYLDKKYTITMDSPGDVIFHTLYFPGWTVLVDSSEVPIKFRQEGIVRVSMPAGTHVVRLVFRNTPIRTWAVLLSVISLVTMISWGILLHRYEHRN